MKVWLFIYKKIAINIATKVIETIKNYVAVSVLIKTQDDRNLGHKNHYTLKSK